MKNKPALIIIGFFIQLTTMSFGRFVYTLVMPSMMKTLGHSTTLMGLLGTGIVAGYLGFSYGSGRLSNTIGSSLTVKLSVLLVSLSLFSLGHFQQYAILLIATVVLGAGAAGSYIPLIHIINNNYEQMGTVFGIVMGGSGAGIILSGYIIPPLLHASPHLGYRLSWYVLSAINSAVLIASFFLLKKEDRGSISDPERKERRMKNIIPLFAHNRALLLTVLVYFLVGFAYIMYVTYFGTYTVDEIGYSERSTGIMWSLFGLNLVYSGLLWGTLADRKGSTRIAFIVTALLALSVSLIIPIPSRPLFYASTFLFGLSFMGFITVIAAILSSEIPRHEMGTVFGAATLIHSSGQVLGAFIAGVLRDWTGTFRVPFTLSLVLLIICLQLLRRLGKIKGSLKNSRLDLSSNIKN